MAVRTKPPKPRRQWIARPHALEALENNLDYGLVLVIAPAGYGKTALASQYAEAHPGTTAWLTLTEAERDQGAFARMLRDILLARQPELAALAPAAAEPEPTAATLLSLMETSGVAPITLFLDDFQHVEASAEATNLLYDLARGLPEQVNIIVLSRVLPRVSPSPLIAQQKAVILGAPTLRFQESELRAAMARLRGVTAEAVSEQDVAEAMSETEGWPAGLSLSEQAAAMTEESGSSGDDKTSDLLDEYLSTAVLNEVPPATLELLVRMSVFDTFDEAQCAQARPADWASGLRDAQLLNLFIHATSGAGQTKTYRLHPQVRAHLRHGFASRSPAEYARALTPAPIAIEATIAPASAPVDPNRNQIQARGFGIGRVWRNGELMTAAQWGYNIPRELLFYMLTAKTSTRERIGGVFWPDASTSAMQRGFHNAKFAIRSALKDQAIQYADGVYSINTGLDLTYDVWEFEKLISAAARAPNDEALKLLLSAADLYTEDFLVDSSLDWALEMRRRLQTKFVRCCIEVSSIALRRNQPELVSELLMRAYYHDRSREELARALILTQAILGNRSAALETYSDLSNMLRREFSINPQPETDELARRIRLGNTLTDLLPPLRRPPV